MKNALGNLVVMAMVIASGLSIVYAGREVILSWNGESNGLADFFTLFGACLLIALTIWVATEVKRLRPKKN